MEYLCKDVFYQFSEKVWTYLFCIEKIQRSKNITFDEKEKIFIQAYRIAEFIYVFSDSVISYIERNKSILIEEMAKPILNITQAINSSQKELFRHMKNDNISYTEEELIKKITDNNNQIIFKKEKLDQMLYFRRFINNEIFKNKKMEINDEMLI